MRCKSWNYSNYTVDTAGLPSHLCAEKQQLALDRCRVRRQAHPGTVLSSERGLSQSAARGQPEGFCHGNNASSLGGPAASWDNSRSVSKTQPRAFASGQLSSANNGVHAVAVCHWHRLCSLLGSKVEKRQKPVFRHKQFIISRLVLEKDSLNDHVRSLLIG